MEFHGTKAINEQRKNSASVQRKQNGGSGVGGICTGTGYELNHHFFFHISIFFFSHIDFFFSRILLSALVNNITHTVLHKSQHAKF